MAEKVDLSKEVKIHLPRGGVIINTKKVGGVQIGIPPETIKDCMTLGISIPGFYVFPKELFDRQHGVNVAEAEFPAYFNYFILKKTVRFICTKAQEAKIRQVFQETLLGPKDPDVLREFVEGTPSHMMPDLKKECGSIRTFHNMDDLFHFTHFDDGVATIGEGVVVKDLGDEFAIIEDDIELGRAPAKVQLPLELWQGSVLSGSQPPFDPPLFGVTILGAGHGFDPSHRTSGFVLWINKRGIMVDPPLNSRGILQRSGVPSRLVDSVIITHCHADHDQGTLQKILEENQISLITTTTIMGSFLRKYSALTDLSEDFLRRLFIFRPVVMGEPMRINGGEIRFFYSIHTIPCIGFEVYYGGKSIYFSADTCYDPVMIKKMAEDGVLGKGRSEFFLNFKWHHNLILHEAGVPPIHTPVSILSALPEDVKKRLYLVHTSKKSVPPETGLKIAPEGVSNSLVLNVTPHIHSEAIELLKVVDSIDMFRILSLNQARELLQVAIPHRYPAGTTIISKGTEGTQFFIVTAGVVQISGENWKKNYVVGDYFGEMSLVTGSRTSADVVAKTDVELVSFRKEDFLSILRGNTETIDFILNLSERRSEPSWQIISANSVLSRVTNAQKTRLQAVMKKMNVNKGENIWKSGETVDFVYIVGEGEVKFANKLDLKEPFKTGAFLGEINAILSGNGVSSTVLVAETDGWGYTISSKDLREFFDHYPGIKLCFMDTIFIDVTKEVKIETNLSNDDVQF